MKSTDDNPVFLDYRDSRQEKGLSAKIREDAKGRVLGAAEFVGMVIALLTTGRTLRALGYAFVGYGLGYFAADPKPASFWLATGGFFVGLTAHAKR